MVYVLYRSGALFRMLDLGPRGAVTAFDSLFHGPGSESGIEDHGSAVRLRP